VFDGDETKYELWKAKFLKYMRLQKLHDVIVPKDGDDEQPDAEKNSNAFTEIVQFIDDRSLCLVIRDAKNGVRKALHILQEHYLGK